ncbi:hypothetical protein AKJ16_DCAP02781 [Drosera capensis]
MSFLQCSGILGSDTGSPVFDANGRVVGLYFCQGGGFDFAVHIPEVEIFEEFVDQAKILVWPQEEVHPFSIEVAKKTQLFEEQLLDSSIIMDVGWQLTPNPMGLPKSEPNQTGKNPFGFEDTRIL